MPNNDRRLIEDLIPIREISAEAANEKSRHQGNISTLHIWWARRPIVAARAAVYGALVPASTGTKERDVYMERIRKLCRWDISNSVLEQARKDILDANGGRPPRVLDMFAGGGSIPLEALRLGCEAYAVELNPVAHIIELCTLVYPQKYGPSLVADVKKWGEWVIERAKAQLAEFYPSPPSQSKQHSDENMVQTTLAGEQHATQSNGELTPIAYLWTRTVPCPNPTCGATVPLVRQTWLRKKEGNYIALKMTPDHAAKKVLFERVQAPTFQGLGFDPEVGSTRGNTVCLLCGATVNLDYIKQKGREGRMGQQLMVVIATREESKGKTYLDNVREEAYAFSQELISQQIALLSDKEKIDLPLEKLQDQDTLNIKLPLYGLTRFIDLFTPRQLLALLVFSAQIYHAHTYMLEEGVEPDRAMAITTYLGLMVDKLADRNSTVCRWDNSRETITNTYARQALPMVWDFAEVNPFGGASGGITGALKWMLEAIQSLVISGQPALVFRTSASQLPLEDGTLDAVITDPPYYDNVSYADLSDFFYVWLKRSIGFLYPEHFSTPLTPKKQEAVMAAYRHNKNKQVAKQSYEAMMAKAFSEAHRVLKPGAPLICVYAHKTTLGWSTLIEALRHAGFVITEAWPLDTEMKARSVAQGTAALASSIFLVARRRENEETGDYVSQVRPQLASIIGERLDTLIGAGVTGADLVIATLGAGLRAYTQFARVEMPNGDEMDAATYLGEVEREVAQHVLQRLLGSTEEGEGREERGLLVAAVDTVTRFYVTGRFFYGEISAPFDDVNLLARGMGVELDGPRGLTQGKKGLAKKEKDTVQLRDYRARGDDEHLGTLSESGNPAALIDVLQRLLWLQDEQPNEVQDFLMKTHPHIEQLRMVAQALAGHALAPAGSNGSTKQERTEEQKAVDRLLAGWRGLFSEMTSNTLWG
jgi:putative DNA methylase